MIWITSLNFAVPPLKLHQIWMTSPNFAVPLLKLHPIIFTPYNISDSNNLLPKHVGKSMKII